MVIPFIKNEDGTDSVPCIAETKGLYHLIRIRKDREASICGELWSSEVVKYESGMHLCRHCLEYLHRGRFFGETRDDYSKAHDLLFGPGDQMRERLKGMGIDSESRTQPGWVSLRVEDLELIVRKLRTR